VNAWGQLPAVAPYIFSFKGKQDIQKKDNKWRAEELEYRFKWALFKGASSGHSISPSLQ